MKTSSGKWSKSATVRTGDPKNVKFSTPTFTTDITVNWNSVKNATGYKFQYSTDKNTWTTITVEDPSATFAVVSGKTYYYRVAAKNSAKTGPWSKIQSVKIG